MTVPNKISVTLSSRAADSGLLEEVGAVFHQWIGNNSLQDILVDVADYRHVARGPGVVLVGHECNYQVREDSERRPQIVCWQKRAFSTSVCPIREVFKRTVKVCRMLEEHTARVGCFDASRARIGARDRLSTNSPRFEVDEFVWHVRQSLAKELFTVPVVQVEGQGALPQVAARWVAERTFRGLDEGQFHPLAGAAS